MRERSLSWSGWQGRDCSLAEPYRATKTSRQLVVAQISTTVTTGGRRAFISKHYCKEWYNVRYQGTD